MFNTRRSNGWFNYQMDVATLLMTDVDFFHKYINSIDPNDFNDDNCKAIISMIKNLWLEMGVRPSYPILYEWVERSIRNEFDKELETEYLNRMRNNEMSEERKRNVLTVFPYFHTQCCYFRLRNEINNNGDGFYNIGQMRTVIKEVMRKARIVEESLNNLEGQIVENKGNNVW